MLLPEVGHGRSYGFFRDLSEIGELHLIAEGRSFGKEGA